MTPDRHKSRYSPEGDRYMATTYDTPERKGHATDGRGSIEGAEGEAVGKSRTNAHQSTRSAPVGDTESDTVGSRPTALAVATLLHWLDTGEAGCLSADGTAWLDGRPVRRPEGAARTLRALVHAAGVGEPG